jgi:hypothetical protein
MRRIQILGSIIAQGEQHKYGMIVERTKEDEENARRGSGVSGENKHKAIPKCEERRGGQG